MSGIDDEARLVDLSTGEILRRYRGKAFRFNRPAMTRDGTRVFTDGGDDAQLWAIETGKVVATLPGPRFGFASVALAPDDNLAAAIGGGGEIWLWAFGDAGSVRHVEANALAVGFAVDGRRIYWIERVDRLCQKDLNGDNVPVCHDIDAGRLGPVDVGAASSITGNDYGSVGFWDNQSGRAVKTWSGGTKAINAVALSSGGKLAVTAGEDHAVRVWRPGSGRMLAEQQCAEVPTVVAMDADGRRVLYGTETGDVHLWTLGTSAP